MMRRAILALLALVALLAPATARLRLHGSLTCPYGSSYPDGCAGANQNAQVKNSEFLLWRRPAKLHAGVDPHAPRAVERGGG